MRWIVKIVFCCYLSANAQIDKEFWFAVPEFTGLHADKPVYLRISSFNSPAEVTISFPANKSLKPYTLSLKANSASSLELTNIIDSLETWPFATIKNTGMLIESTSDISVYYEVLGYSPLAQGPANTDIFSLKGHNALGNKFFTPFQTNWRAYPDIDAWAAFSIVATQDNTVITIIPTQDLIDHPKGISFTITLNRGQNYALRAESQDNALRPAGTLITSSKPIAVTINDDSMFEGLNWDSAGDQIIPANVVGNEYIAIKASPVTRIIDRIYICAVEDNTEVFVGNQSVATTVLSSGVQFEYVLVDSATYIKSNKPVYVFQVGGFTTELGGAILPPLGCTGSKQVGIMRSNEEDFALAVLVKTGGEKNFLVNGNANYLTKADFFDVKNTNQEWKFAKVFFDTSAIVPNKPTIISNSSNDFHLAIMNGNFNTGFRFGFFSDFGFLDLGSDKTLCLNDSVKLDAGFGKDTYQWSTGKTSQSITVRDTGFYSVSVTKGNCKYDDNIRVFQNPSPGSLLPADTSICVNQKWRIKAKNGFVKYQWNFVETSSVLTANRTGEYIVTVTDSNTCSYKDTTNLQVNNLPTPTILIPKKEIDWCADSIITLTLAQDYESYKWNTSLTTKVYSGLKTIDNFYKVEVLDSNGCVGLDSLTIDCSPYITISNVITPNNDLQNDTWKIKGLIRGYWEVNIFNRYGKKVYESKDYDNTWDGGQLPPAIYYYNLTHKNGKGNYKGWVEILE